MTTKLFVLIVEDSDDDADLLLRELRRMDYDVYHKRVMDGPALREALHSDNWDIVLSDYSLPNFNALAALKIVAESGLDIPFIILSGTVGEEAAVEALKAGAHDFIVKGRYARLLPAIERELRDSRRRRLQRDSEEHQKKLEKQLHTMQRLDALGKISGGVAHDFNNVLTAIFGHVFFLRQRLENDAEGLQDLDAIVAAAENAQRLTSQLLAFGRRQVQQLSVVNINRVANEVSALLSRTLPANIGLQLALTDNLGNVRADVSQIEQILMNLVINARDAMPEGGKITVETNNVRLDENYAYNKGVTIPSGDYVQLVVTDTGIGMDPETQAHIFEPFFTTKGEQQGTGLGLATVYGIVKQSQGYIWVYSEPGVGTTFKIYLPRVASAESQRARTTSADANASGNETVLLIEDQEIVRRAAARILQSRKYKVIEAGNGQEALSLAADPGASFDLVITDMVLPDIDGIQLCRRIRQHRPDIKVVYMSGYTDAALVGDDGLEAGAAFINKPFAIPEFLSIIRGVLDKKAPR